MDPSSPDCGESSFLEDIEDIIGGLEDAPVERLARAEVGRDLSSREKRRKRQERAIKREEEEQTRLEQDAATKESDNEPAGGAQEGEEGLGLGLSNVPGVAKVFVKTWGCAHNNSDGEYMAGLLSEYGYEIVLEDHEAKDANVWLLNSCTVKGPAESHFVNSITDAQSQGKKVIVAGCVPQAWGSSKTGRESQRRANAQDLSVIGVQQIDRVVEVVEQTLLGNTVRLMGTKTEKKVISVPVASSSDVGSSGEREEVEMTQRSAKVKLGGAKLDLPKIRRNPLVEIVPISTGRLNACTYCKTKHARGHLGSYSVEEIVNRIKQVVSEGVLEIWLTSEDTGAYGIDIGTDITTLLWAILEVLPEPVMLRMGMTNPPYIKRHAIEMAKIYQHPRIYAYLHMPIQSAANAVLETMKREYTRKDFEEIVDALKGQLPYLNVATDLIIGFPGETDADFEETWDLVQKYQFSVLFINQFYPRPGTPAAKMKRVNTQVVKDRTRKLSAWFKNYLPYETRLGEIHSILVTEMAPDNIHVAGRTKSYEMVLVDSPLPLEKLMGRVIEVKITETGKFFLKGTPTEHGLSSLESQVLPKETVLRRQPRTVKVTANTTMTQSSSSSSSSVPIRSSATTNARLDYHEGDDGEDYDENAALIDEDDETQDFGGCGDCGDGCGDCGSNEEESGCSTCGPAGCGDCGEKTQDTTAKRPSSTISAISASSSAPEPSHVGPSDKISLSSKRAGVQFKVAAQEDGPPATQKIFAFTILLLGVFLMNWPWLKRYL